MLQVIVGLLALGLFVFGFAGVGALVLRVVDGYWPDGEDSFLAFAVGLSVIAGSAIIFFLAFIIGHVILRGLR